jgi:hypothetical protein
MAVGWYDDYDLPQDLRDDLDDIIGNDNHLADLFEAALFDGIHGAGGDSHKELVQDLADYLAEQYGIDIDEDLDAFWEDWRTWYEG